MNKILLVYEDYAELMSAEATLKKVGFDVLGLSSEYSISEQILAFNPDLVVGSGRGGKVSSLGVGKRLKEMQRWQGKVVLLFPANFKPGPQDLIRIRVDMVLESSVTPLRLMQVIGRLLGHEESVLVERLNKNIKPDSNGKMTFTGGGGGPKQTPEAEAIYVRGQVDDSGNPINSSSDRSDVVNDNKTFAPSSAKSSEERFSFKFGDRLTASQVSSEKSLGKEEASEAFPDVDLSSLEKELLGGGAPAVERIELNPVFEEAEISKDVQALLNSESAKNSEETSMGSTEKRTDKAVGKNREGGKSSAGGSEAVSKFETKNQSPNTQGNVKFGLDKPANPESKASSFDFSEEARSEKVSGGGASGSEGASDLTPAMRALQDSQRELPQKIAKYTQLVKNIKVAPKSTVTRVEARRRQKELIEDLGEQNLNELDELRREFTKAMFKK